MHYEIEKKVADPNDQTEDGNVVSAPKKRKGLPLKQIFISFLLVSSAFGVLKFISYQSNYLITQNQDSRSQAAVTSAPSVVVFMIDDLDVDLLQQMVASGKMPNLKNLLIDKGTSFTNAFVNRSVCCTSRATFLTGKYAHNHGVWNVLGPERQSPEGFSTYLSETNNAYLPTWLKSKNYRNIFIGKWHLGSAHPNIDPGDGVELNGYDLRPGAYQASTWGIETTRPLVYQTKYLGDTAKSKITNSDKPTFAYLAPNAVHTAVNIFPDKWVDTLPGLPNKNVVASTEFRSYQSNNWTQHIVTQNNGTYEWWYRTGGSGTTPSYPINFTNIGNQVTTIISGKTLVGWNTYSNPNENVQQAILKEGANYQFYSRKVSGGQATEWTYNGDSSTVLAGTATNLPLSGWAALSYPNGAIRQQILQGTAETGLKSFVRYKTATGGFSNWVEDTYWGDTVAFYQPVGFNLAPYGSSKNPAQAQYQITLTTLDTSGKPSIYRSAPLPDFYQINSLGNPTMITDAESDVFADEAGIYAASYMQYQPSKKISEGDEESNSDNNANVAGVSSAQNRLHPYFLMRAPAEGSWYPIAPGQTYDWGGKYPAGSLRAGNDVNSVDYLANFKPLSFTKPSYNKPLSGAVPPWYQTSWPTLTPTIWGATSNDKMLARLTLDRMEQLMSVDKMVGEVVNHSLSINSNTLFIFTSDNGHFNGEHQLGNKYTAHEESIKVPLYIRAPGQTTAKQVSRLVGNVDLAPTILDYAGISWEDKVDGRSLKPLVEGEQIPWRNILLIQHQRPNPDSNPSASDWAFGLPAFKALRIITGSLNELYVHYKDPKTPEYFERYNMTTDKYQETNIASGANSVYENLINAFAGCKGASCRTADIFNSGSDPIPNNSEKPTLLDSKNIIIRAKGVYSNGSWPLLELHIKNSNGVYTKVKTFTIHSSRFKNFRYRSTTPFNASQVRLKFVNDDGPRNVTVDHIRFGTKKYPTIAPGTYSTGSWSSTTKVCTPGYPYDVAGYQTKDTLACNGYFDYFKK